MAKESPIYKGKRHYDKDGNPLGGIKVLVDGSTIVEVEGGEMRLCSESYNSNEVLEFKQKTNKEVIDFIHNDFSCKWDNHTASSGDFILCRLVVNDTAKHDRKGTVRQILDAMQGEKSCRVSFGDKAMKQGGEISEAELHKRWAKKKNQVQHLSKKIQSLRYNLTRDLKSDNEKTFLTALVVSIMERTGERVGNELSSDNGHYGVTVLEKSHISIDKNTITLDYVGKSGVSHKKSFSDEAIADALRKAIKNSPDDCVFCTSGGFRVKQDRVNRFLKDFGIRSKDLRGFQANKWTIDALNKIEVIEKDEKKRKKQFGKVLKAVAKKVGHGVATLRKHYLMPEVESRFVEKKKILDLSKFFKEGGKMELPKSALPKDSINITTKGGQYETQGRGAYADVDKRGGVWEIKMIESEKKGHGTEILNKIIEDAKSKGVKKIVLTTTEHSGWGFFDKNGFKEVREYDDEEDGGSYIDMEMLLVGKKETGGELSRRIVVGCFIYAQDTDEYLFLQRCTFSGDNRGKWHILSGCGNEGESTDDTARREIKEEVGYDGEYSHFEMIEIKKFPDYDFYYYAVTVPKRFRVKLDWENKKFNWVKSIYEFRKYDLIPEFEKYLDELLPQEKKEDGGFVVEHFSRPQTLIEQLVNLI
jgi:8-oxo-dGTP pyrophosphatase MutT (NUDIX family)